MIIWFESVHDSFIWIEAEAFLASWSKLSKSQIVSWVVTERKIILSRRSTFFDCEYKLFWFQHIVMVALVTLAAGSKKSREVLLFSSGSAFTVFAFAKPLRFAWCSGPRGQRRWGSRCWAWAGSRCEELPSLWTEMVGSSLYLCGLDMLGWDLFLLFFFGGGQDFLEEKTYQKHNIRIMVRLVLHMAGRILCSMALLQKKRS